MNFDANGTLYENVQIPIPFNEVLEGDRDVTVSLETNGEDGTVTLSSNSSVNATITDASK